MLSVFWKTRDRAVMAAVNSTHKVPDPRTTKKVMSRVSLGVKIL